MEARYTQSLHVRIVGQRVKYRFQGAVVPPFGESGVHGLPGTIGLRQLTPSSAAPDDPKHPVYHGPVILPRAAPLPRFFRWQQQLDSFPLFFY